MPDDWPPTLLDLTSFTRQCKDRGHDERPRDARRRLQCGCRYILYPIRAVRYADPLLDCNIKLSLTLFQRFRPI